MACIAGNSKYTSGAAFSILEEVDNIPVASEGDILGAISQIIAKSFTGKVGYLLDMTEPDFDRMAF